MSFSVQRLSDLPALLLTAEHNYNPITDFPRSYPVVLDMLNREQTPVYYVLDLSEVQFDLEMIVQGANSTSRTNGGTFHHPMVREVLIVSPSDVIHSATRGLQTDSFGNVRARAFSNVNEALSYISAQG